MYIVMSITLLLSTFSSLAMNTSPNGTYARPRYNLFVQTAQGTPPESPIQTPSCISILSAALQGAPSPADKLSYASSLQELQLAVMFNIENNDLRQVSTRVYDLIINAICQYCRRLPQFTSNREVLRRYLCILHLQDPDAVRLFLDKNCHSTQSECSAPRFDVTLPESALSESERMLQSNINRIRDDRFGYYQSISVTRDTTNIRKCLSFVPYSGPQRILYQLTPTQVTPTQARYYALYATEQTPIIKSVHDGIIRLLKQVAQHKSLILPPYDIDIITDLRYMDCKEPHTLDNLFNVISLQLLVTNQS